MRLWILGLLIVLACGMVGVASAVVYDDNVGDPSTDRTLEDAGFDFDSSGKLTIEEDFTYQMSDNVKLTLMKGGKITVKVEQSKFQEATIDLSVQVEISIEGSTLKLKGSVTGKIDAYYEIDFTGKLRVEEDFTYQASDNVKLTLVKGGKLTVKVEQSKFEEATLDLRVLAEIQIKGQGLKLKGAVSGKINGAREVDFTGELTVEEDFTYQASHSVRVTLFKGGKVTGKVETSKFTEATLNLRVQAEIQIKGQSLKLKGPVTGKIDSDYKINFTGKVKLLEDFTYKASDSVRLTLVKGGKLTVKVEQSKFKWATLNLTVQADIQIKDQDLKLEGSVSGKINGAYEVDFTGELRIKEDFTYQASDNIKLTLTKGGKVSVRVEKSEFKEATLNLRVLAEVQINGSTLKLKGPVTGKIDADHNIKFTGTVFRKGVRLPGQGEDQDGEEQVRRDDP